MMISDIVAYFFWATLYTDIFRAVPIR